MVAMVHTGPLLGLGAQVVVLAALSPTVGIGLDGWLAGLAYGLVVCLASTLGLRRSGARRLGPADRVTLGRATLVGVVLALTVHGLRAAVPLALLVATASLALALDAVDGPIARRTRSASAFGARFDMEIDAFLILVLSVWVARELGAWVLAIGVMRYAFWAASRFVPWLRTPMPPSYWRKTVAAVQGIVLVAAASMILPGWLSIVAVAVALALLLWSFGTQVVWQWRVSRGRPGLWGHGDPAPRLRASSNRSR
jgi:phosphatidylglycerophosphate synthase